MDRLQAVYSIDDILQHCEVCEQASRALPHARYDLFSGRRILHKRMSGRRAAAAVRQAIDSREEVMF